MKKQLLASLAAAMVLGIAGTSFAAANPFVDVPAKHWAYGSVTKLAQAGIVEGYGDATYRGDKLISRYEMAQMVAKAMTRSDKADAMQKAEINKLAAEFSEELNNLGVRVTSLEKRVGTIKLSGDARLRFVDDSANNTKFSERLRINFNADINKDTSFYGRFRVLDHNEFGTASSATPSTNEFTDAAFTTKNIFGTSNTSTTLGRFSQKFLNVGYFSDTTGLVDGAKITVGNKLKVTAGFANFAQASGAKAAGYKTATIVDGDDNEVDVLVPVAAVKGDIEEAVFAELSYDLSKATNVKAMMLKEQTGADSNFDVKGVSFSTKLSKDFALAADYTQNADQNDASSTVARLSYKGANKSVQGTWGVYGEYIKMETGANSSGMTAAMIPVTNIKGYNVGGNYTLAKNITLDAMYTFNNKVASSGVDTANYTRAQVNYMF